jgi:hypothetical protein
MLYVSCRYEQLAVRNSSHAGVAELADALDLGSSAFGRGGSTPSTRTKRKPGGRGGIGRHAILRG